MLMKLNKTLGNLRGDNRGSTAAEFALLSVPFMMIVLTIFETGILMYRDRIMESAAQEAARDIRTGQLAKGPTAVSTFVTRLCEEAFETLDPDTGSCVIAVDVRTFDSFEDIYEDSNGDGVYDNLPDITFDADGNPENTVFALESDSGVSVTGRTVVVVRVIREAQFTVPGIGTLVGQSTSPFKLSHTVIFRTEPF